MTDLSNDIEKFADEVNAQNMGEDESKASDCVASVAKGRFSSGASEDNTPVAGNRRTSESTFLSANQNIQTNNENSTVSASDMNASWNSILDESNVTNGVASLANDRFSPGESEDKAPAHRPRRSSVSDAFSMLTNKRRSSVSEAFSSLTNDNSSLKFKSLERPAVEERSERKSALCCGFCCDLVRGCIIANILNLCVTIFLLYICLHNDDVHELFLAIDEDPVGLRGILDPRDIIGIIRTSLMIPFAVIGILGAWRFNKYMIICAAIWYMIDLIAGLTIGAWTNVVLSTVYCYAHVHLFLELKNGRITDENYKRTEEYCCWRCIGTEKNQNRQSEVSVDALP